MKHLKIYEALHSNYKNYILCKSNENLYYILELLDLKNQQIPWCQITTRILYTYKKSIDKLYKTDNEILNFEPEKYGKHIIYQSNNLQEVLKMIPTLKNIDKYNL